MATAARSAVKTKPKAARAIGRPSDYAQEMLAEASEMYAAGYSDREVAVGLGIGMTTLYRWREMHPEFRQSAKAPKLMADERVQNSLYMQALGYDYVEQQAIKVKDGDYERVEVVEVVRHKPAETTAQIFWLKNRQPDNWNDRRELNVSGSLEVKGSERDVALAMIQLLREAADDESEPEPTLIEHDPVERPTVVQSERSRRFG